MRRRSKTALAGLVVLSLVAAEAVAAAPGKRVGPDPETYERTVQRAINFLTNRAQAEDGSYAQETGLGVTALATTALLKHGRTPSDPAVAKSLKYLEGFAQEDGGIYTPKSTHRNYETCLSIMCFSEANKDGRYDKILERAEKFVKGIQWAADEGQDEADMAYGGAGYGSHKRPDLSNTSFLVEALKELGNGPDDEAMQRALIFVTRAQNFESKHNTAPFAPKNPDGGFFYTPANGGESQAGKTPNGGLRSYASMTYAGLKSMIFAGVEHDDPRVKAATDWIRKHYDLESNPGMGAAGLYYYYHTFAKALDALELDYFEDNEGNVHDWRQELTRELAERQQADGSWLNEANERWLEGNPALVTGYSLLALSYCRPKTVSPK